MIKILDICSGIGGFSLGLEATGGFDTVAFCEFDDFCCKVLNKHWPNVPIYKDLKEIGNDPERIIQEFDLICGGIPCQPFSLAGKQKGKEDDRHLWPYMYAIVKSKKPTWVIVENVGGFVNVALDDVCLDLETQGYATQSFIIPACSVEAPHKRDRIWILGKLMANAQSNGEDGVLRTTESEHDQGDTRMESSSSSDRLIERGISQDVANAKLVSSDSISDSGSNTKTESEQGQKTGNLDRSSGRQDVANSKSSQSGEQTQWEGGEDTQRGSVNSGGLENKGREDVPHSSSQRLEGHRGEHGLREASQEEQASRSSEERDVPNPKELTRHVDDNGHSGQDDGQQREGLQGELGGESGNRAEDVANTERLGQQGQREPKRPGNTAQDSDGQTGRPNDGSQGSTGQGHTEPGVGGVADGIPTRLDGHLGFAVEPSIPRVATGIPERVNRLKALGNSIVPQIVYNIGLAILEEEERTNVAK